LIHMKRYVFTLLFALLASTAIFADTIHYDTTPGSVFNCVNSGSLSGCSTSQVTIGGTVLLTYLPTVSSVDITLPGAPSSNANFGNIVVTCVDNTTTCAAQAIAQGALTLTVNIHQTTADDLTGAIPSARIFGSIGGASSSTVVQWNQGTSVDLLGTKYDDLYSIQNTTLGLVAPGSGGTTTIQGQLQAAPGTGLPAPIPEPAISMLCAGGLMAIGAIRRRK
jgi:hypothetical protein